MSGIKDKRIKYLLYKNDELVEVARTFEEAGHIIGVTGGMVQYMLRKGIESSNGYSVKKLKKGDPVPKTKAEEMEAVEAHKGTRYEIMPLCSRDPYGRMIWRISERGGANARAYTNG